MTNEYLTLLEEADEDVILEGSELYQALLNVGYTNFDSIPRIKNESPTIKIDSSISNNYKFFKKFLNDKVNLIQQYIFQDNRLRKEILKYILEGNVLLDDHAIIVNEFLNEQQISQSRRVLEWFPFVSSTVATAYTLFMKKSNITTALSFASFTFFIYKKFNSWDTVKNVKYFILLQSELHHLLKQSLKILRRSYGKKLIINKIHEKNELLGPEKYNIILLIKQLIIEIFEKLSHIYYQEASKILNILPDLCLNCTLTELEVQNEPEDNNKIYDYLKSLYYTFILVQSEMLFIMTNAYNGEAKNIKISKIKLTQIIKDLSEILTVYYSKMSKLINSYQSCEIQPIKRVFRGIPNSIWQDVYMHLDLTSQKVQSAYKQITSILESVDLRDEKDHDNPQLIEFIIEKMNETYKEIENARSFAEFSTLLIAKVQCKLKNTSEKENEKENEIENVLPNNDNCKVIIIDKDPEIQDEVFEEYIKEEYLKPLYENSDESIIQNFKLDKLLAKNFMTELKEALIEKQKSMTERELKALKRMYNKVIRDSGIDKIELEKFSENKTSTTSSSILLPSSPLKTPPPPPPPLPPPSPPRAPSLPPLPPPPILKDTIIAKNYFEDDEKTEIKIRTPIPHPRVKTLQPEDILPNVERFSINQCAPNLRFPSLTEETFVGSGENSEEEFIQSDNEDEDNEDSNDN